MRRIISNLLLILLLMVPVSAENGWIEYSNQKFGYSFELPAAMVVSNRPSDGSGLTWQTGTVRIQASGTNNRYDLKPEEYFERMRFAAADKIVEQSHGVDPQTRAHWFQMLYTKDGRRIHQKTYVGEGTVNSLEFSYAYRYRKQKESVGVRVLDSFKPGDLSIERD